MRTLAALLFLVPLPDLSAQLNHDRVPVVNIVGAGLDLQGAAEDAKVDLYATGIGTIATVLLATNKDTRHTAGPWIAGGLTLGVSFTFQLSSLKWMKRSASLLQCGYSPDYLYESIPDSLGDDPPRHYRMPRMIENTPIHLPARMR